MSQEADGGSTHASSETEEEKGSVRLDELAASSELSPIVKPAVTLSVDHLATTEQESVGI